jgi:hypothetical protein
MPQQMNPERHCTASATGNRNLMKWQMLRGLAP